MLILNLVKKKINTTVYLFMINIYRKYIFSVNKYTYLSLYYTGIYIFTDWKLFLQIYSMSYYHIMLHTWIYIYIQNIFTGKFFSTWHTEPRRAMLQYRTFVWSVQQQHSCPRDWCLSASGGTNWGPPWNPPYITAPRVKSLPDKLIAVRETGVSRHRGGPIEGPPETPRTPQHYHIEGIKVCQKTS